MTHASLFTGIGGFDLAAEWTGIENVFQVENDKFCQKVLEKNFPNVKRYLDIKDFDGTEYKNRIDIISGGFPCQPFSQAGKRKGNKDERALFPEMLRIIREVKPKWIVGENVSGILSIHDGEYFEEILTSLENEGYKVQSFIIPASAVNAPHRRDRVWIIANSNNSTSARQRKHSGKILPYKESEGLRDNWSESWYEVATRLCRISNGLSDWLDRNKGLEKYAEISNKITGQDMPYLWHYIQSESFQWEYVRFKKVFYQETCSQSCGNSLANPTDRTTYHLRAQKFKKRFCETCGTDKNLDAHHKDSNIKNNTETNIQTLCHPCHMKLHWQQKKLTKTITKIGWTDLKV